MLSLYTLGGFRVEDPFHKICCSHLNSANRDRNYLEESSAYMVVKTVQWID